MLGLELKLSVRDPIVLTTTLPLQCHIQMFLTSLSTPTGQVPGAQTSQGSEVELQPVAMPSALSQDPPSRCASSLKPVLPRMHGNEQKTKADLSALNNTISSKLKEQICLFHRTIMCSTGRRNTELKKEQGESRSTTVTQSKKMMPRVRAASVH